MSLSSIPFATQNNYPNNPEFSHILAVVPPVMPQPVPGYQNMLYRIDGTIARGTWNCSCGPSPSTPAFGVPANDMVVIDPATVSGGAYYNQANCSDAPASCVDPSSVNYNTNAVVGQHISCVYRDSQTIPDAYSARALNTQVNRAVWRPHNHLG